MMAQNARKQSKGPLFKGTLLANREPQENSRNIMEYMDPGRYIPIIYLLYSWGSRFGVPSRVPLLFQTLARLLQEKLKPMYRNQPLEPEKPKTRNLKPVNLKPY